MDPAFIKAIIDGGVAVVLAVVVIYWQRVDAKARIEEVKRQVDEAKCERDQERERTDRMTKALEDNTRVYTEIVETLRALKEAVERGSQAPVSQGK